MLELSEDTRNRLSRLFYGEAEAEAVRLLEEECGNNLPFCEDSDPGSMDRVRFGVLKLSQGDIGKLKEAIKLAQIDWRDLLVAAGFAEDTQAHRKWSP